jgi:hypothetical protein
MRVSTSDRDGASRAKSSMLGRSSWPPGNATTCDLSEANLIAIRVSLCAQPERYATRRPMATISTAASAMPAAAEQAIGALDLVRCASKPHPTG